MVTTQMRRFFYMENAFDNVLAVLQKLGSGANTTDSNLTPLNFCKCASDQSDSGNFQKVLYHVMESWILEKIDVKRLKAFDL